MDWRLAKAASACAATSDSGIAATFVLAGAAVAALPASADLSCANASNRPLPDTSSSTAPVTGAHFLNRRGSFFIVHRLDSDRCITKLQRPQTYSDCARPARIRGM